MKNPNRLKSAIKRMQSQVASTLDAELKMPTIKPNDNGFDRTDIFYLFSIETIRFRIAPMKTNPIPH